MDDKTEYKYGFMVVEDDKQLEYDPNETIRLATAWMYGYKIGSR